MQLSLFGLDLKSLQPAQQPLDIAVMSKVFKAVAKAYGDKAPVEGAILHCERIDLTLAKVDPEGTAIFIPGNVRRHESSAIYLKPGARVEVHAGHSQCMFLALSPNGAEILASPVAFPSFTQDPALATDPERAQVNAWLHAGQRGMSSEAICHQLYAAEYPEVKRACARRFPDDVTAHPHDPADFRRCALFLEAVPAAVAKFDRMASLSPQWAALVPRWQEIHRTLQAEFAAETGEKAASPQAWEGSAPKGYALMREILDPLDRPRAKVRP